MRGKRINAALMLRLAASVVWAFLPILWLKVLGSVSVGYLTGPYIMLLFGYGVLIPGFQSAFIHGLRVRLHREQMQNISRIFHRTLPVACLVGVVLALAGAFGAMGLSELFTSSRRGTLVWLVMAPALLLMGPQGVLEGYLAGLDLAKAVLARVISAGVALFASILLSIPFGRYGEKVAALLHTEDLADVYAAVGVAAGLSLGSLAGLIYLIVLYLIHRRQLDERLRSGSGLVLDGRRDVIARGRYTLVSYGLPELLLAVDAVMYRLTAMRVHPTEQNTANIGLFMGGVIALCAVIGILCCIPYLSSWSSLCVAVRRGDLSGARGRMDRLVHFGGILLFPVVLWLMILAEPVCAVIAGQSAADAAAPLLVITAPVIILFATALLISYVIMEMGRFGILVIDLVLGGVMHLIVLLILCLVQGYGLHALIAAWAAGLFVMDLAGTLEICGMLSYRQEWIRGLAMPFLCAAGSAAIVAMLEKWLIYQIGEVLTIMVAVIVALVIYMVALVLCRALNRYELERVPFGRFLMPLAERLER
ncbi:MAG: polysaccharide biosynthesis C-terminal domain-containing protein [Butyrivibrio sp.]|nr:polysaccharide biosynthesis C-terminal domain-containing protein [Butyrivibrio sp.]